VTGSSVEGRSPASRGSFLQRHNTGSIIVSALLQDEGEVESVDVDRYRRSCGCWWTSNMRVLLVTGVSCLVITLTQTFAAIVANSAALKADCVAGGVDSLAYFLNIFVEALKGKKGHRAAELLVPAASIGFLTVFTTLVLWDSIEILTGLDDADDEEEVNPWIVFGFTMWGLVYDVGCLLLFRRNLQRSGEKIGVNMLGVLLNLAADFVRGFVTLIESVLIIAFGFDGVITDAWACCFVSGIILLGAVYAIFEWITDACGGRQEVAQSNA